SLHIITGHARKGAEANIDYEALVRLEGTLVFLMGVTAMKQICEGLLAAGMAEDMPAAILEKGTTARQRRVVATIRTLWEEGKKAKIQTPAIIVVGKVCSLSETFGWAEKRPLAGLKIAVTRPKDRPSYLAEQLALYGAEIVHLPTIRTEEIEENQPLIQAMENRDDYSWIVFTSPVGVEIFFKKLRALRVDVRALGNIKVAAIGWATKAAIEEKGILVELMPPVYNGASLGELLAARVSEEEGKTGERKKILIPRAEMGAEDLIKPLAKHQLDYVDLPIYQTCTEEHKGFFGEDIDYVAFTSASTVLGFVKLWEGRPLDKLKAVCIGESTAAAARKQGMKVLVAEMATMDSMLQCFLNFHANVE
ncbi:MAG: uroporphyrinogen-III synthase, partial [Anaerovorax sp.]